MTAHPLAPCPFCGGEAGFEWHPDHHDIVRIACGSDGCAIRPATEYLLREFRVELCAAWNARPRGGDAASAARRR